MIAYRLSPSRSNCAQIHELSFCLNSVRILLLKKIQLQKDNLPWNSYPFQFFEEGVYIYIHIFISLLLNSKYSVLHFICQIAQNLMQSPLLCSVQKSLSMNQGVSIDCWRLQNLASILTSYYGREKKKKKTDLKFSAFAINSNMGITYKNPLLFPMISWSESLTPR